MATGHIKATDADITALAQTPKEEIPAIIKELRKPKKDRKAKKPTSPEKSDVAADDAPDSNEVHTEDEIEPVSNSPPDFKRSIQGHTFTIKAPLCHFLRLPYRQNSILNR